MGVAPLVSLRRLADEVNHMTTSSSTPRSALLAALLSLAAAGAFAAPATTQSLLPPPAVTPLPGGCPAGPVLTGAVSFGNVTLNVTTPCEVGPVVVVFGFDFQLAPPTLLPWGCGPGLCELDLMPAVTAATFGFAPAVTQVFAVPPAPVWPIYAQSLVIGTSWSLSNPVRIG